MKSKEVLFAVAIIVLTIFVTFYGINTIFPKPVYEDFCGRGDFSKPTRPPEICPTVCVELYEIENEKCVFNDCGSGCGADNVNTFETFEDCEDSLLMKNCYDDFDNALKQRSRKVFFLALPLGILIILGGAFFFGLEIVGAGLMGGGVGTLIYGSGAYWPYSENWIRFLISLIGLVILIWFIYWLNNRNGKKRRR